MTRGTCLIIEKSVIRARAAVVRHPLTLQIVTTQNSRNAAEEWCRRNWYSWIDPVKDAPWRE
jgi:hypothetical protein